MSAPAGALAAVRNPVAQALGDYAELTKPRITLMVMLTALVGFYLGASAGAAAGASLTAAMIGTGLVAAGASALNMVMERRSDALMNRTRLRPLPAGRITVPEAVIWGGALTACGLLCLQIGCGTTATLVAVASWLSYLFLYTPLKSRTSLSTVVGAVPGALPPVIGWAAARGTIDPGAVVLFAILFLWQLPHFLAIGWLYREDYRQGGLPMLAVVDPDGRMSGRQSFTHTVALVAVSFAPGATMAGPVYLAGAALLGALFLVAAWRMRVACTTKSARALFLASLVYLTGLCVLLLVDRV